MRCVKCGQEIQGVNVCPYCGANQVAVPNQPVNNQVAPTSGQTVINNQVNVTNSPQVNTNVVPENSADVTNNEEELLLTESKQNNKMFYILFALVSLIVLIIFIYITIQYFNPRIEITAIKNEYNYTEFINETFNVEGSMFIDPANTSWVINGYEFTRGTEAANIPVVIGENTLVVKNRGASNTYYFTISNDSTILIDGNYAITQDYQDFDRDGISNIVEDEKGTSSSNNDTDGDGLYDNVELIMGLNPKSEDKYDEVRDYKVIQNNDKTTKNYLLVQAKGNVANTYLDTIDMNVGFSSTFIQSDTLRVTTTNPETPDKMYIYFSKDSNWNTQSYSIYMFDEKTNKLTELPTKITDNYLTATIEEFDNVYFVGKKDNVPKEYLNQIIILIDNSGSMFPMEYVTSNKNANPNSYGHDTGFKRLDLMNGLVDTLGTENYEYSVYGFTANYCELIKYSQDKNAIKRSINSLKSECQRFNGTDMSGAIKKYASTFKKDVYGTKYIIVLTDGLDTGNNVFNLSEYYLNDYRKQGIHIITLGLSSEVDSDYLMNIAYLTKGKYLFASDANMLDALAEIIESSINKSNETTTFEEKEYSLVADSGFQVDRDGFSFKNFGSTDSPTSNSFGFSYLAKLLYLNNLYDENGKSEIISTKLTKGNQSRMIKGNVYKIELTDEYNELLYNSETKIDLTNTSNKDDDYQLLQVINKAFQHQNKTFLLKINDYVLKHFQGQFFDYDNDLTKLIDELQSGSPAVLSLSSSAGTHSVLATKIEKANGTDEYVITVYDSDTPGEEGKIHLTRTSAYYEYANSSYYIVNYNSNGIEYNNILYVDQYN